MTGHIDIESLPEAQKLAIKKWTRETAIWLRGERTRTITHDGVGVVLVRHVGAGGGVGEVRVTTDGTIFSTTTGERVAV
jgi:hypothetical protein